MNQSQTDFMAREPITSMKIITMITTTRLLKTAVANRLEKVPRSD